MILNSKYTDGYTYRVSFARIKEDQLDRIELNLNDFQIEEIDRYFRSCTVDPRSKNMFPSFYDEDKLWHLITTVYYNTAGSMINEDIWKQKMDVKEIETDTPKQKLHPSSTIYSTYNLSWEIIKNRGGSIYL